MSNDFVSVLAEQFGASEALIQRSADARAAAGGSTADAILATWAGGAPPPAPTDTPVPVPAPVDERPKAAAPVPVPETVEAPADGPPPPEPSRPDPDPAPEPAPPAHTEPSPKSSLSAVLVGSLAVFAVMFVVAVIAPTSRSNAETLDALYVPVLSADGAHGRDVYLAEGCAYCHTQQVRPVVTDADLGTITLSESPLVPGYQRHGPDLAHVGSREPTDGAAWLTGYLVEAESLRPESPHPSYGYLTEADMQDLVEYLLESK